MDNLSRKRRWSLVMATLLLAVNLNSVTGYSSGASPAVCDTMIPGHGGASSQNSPSPFSIKLGKTAVSGLQPLDITLSGQNDPFHGFLLQVRKVGGDGKAAGEFKEDPANSQVKPMDCFNLKNSAMTHTSSDPKKSVTVQWIPPNDADAEYEVFYSAVKDFSTFWAHTPHTEKVRVTRDAAATTTAAPIQIASTELLQKWRAQYKGCGETKGCFGIPGKCVEEFDPTSDNPTTCEIMVTWADEGGKYIYELSGNPGGSQGYVAVGLSQDSRMGTDSVVGCVNTGSGTPSVERYHNPSTDKVNQKYSNVKEGIVAVTEQAVQDGHIFCKFQQKDHSLGDLSIDFGKNYYLLLARASSTANDRLPYHQRITDREVSPQSVHISDAIIMGASPNNWLIQLHGGLMVIAWLLCASTGMFTARYLKTTHTDFTPFGKAFWFALHVFCMSATVFLTICGAVFIIIKKKGIDLHQTHPILGVIVIGLAFLQVIIAFLRPHPGTPSRPYFNWFHWAVGNAAHIVGIICILMASELSLADLKRFGDEYLWNWILLGIVLFHVLMHIVMSIHTLWADKQMDSNNKKRAMVPGPMKSNGLNDEAPGTAFRTFMLALYILVMAGGAVALTALVFWPKDDDPSS